MIGVELIDTETGELSYLEVARLAMKDTKAKMILKNGSKRIVSTKRFILRTVKTTPRKDI